MKKAGLGIIGIALIAIIYYVSLGSTQLTEELKATVNKELNALESHGFTIKERTIKEKEEHFQIVFDDTTKIATFLNEEGGAAITAEESAALKGMKIGVDVNYLKDNYSAISLDLYPTTLPDSLTNGDLSSGDKKAVDKINQLFADKTFLIHIDINKMLNGYRGNMKDIDEVFGEAGSQVTMQMKGMLFSGDIANEDISSIEQTLENFLIKAEDELDIQISGLKSHYYLDGPTRYDTTTGYEFDKIVFKEAATINLLIEHFKASSKTVTIDSLANSTVHSSIKSIQVYDQGKSNKLTNLSMDMKADNLDIQGFEKLQHINTLDQTQIDNITQQILSKGISFEISKLSVENLYTENKEIGGFDIDAKVDIDKNIDLKMIQSNPMLGLAAVEAQLNLSLSENLHTLIAQQPQALIAMMMFQPKTQNGNKVYEIRLENGALTVNGVAMQ